MDQWGRKNRLNIPTNKYYGEKVLQAKPLVLSGCVLMSSWKKKNIIFFHLSLLDTYACLCEANRAWVCINLTVVYLVHTMGTFGFLT